MKAPFLHQSDCLTLSPSAGEVDDLHAVVRFGML